MASLGDSEIVEQRSLTVVASNNLFFRSSRVRNVVDLPCLAPEVLAVGEGHVFEPGVLGPSSISGVKFSVINKDGRVAFE